MIKALRPGALPIVLTVLTAVSAFAAGCGGDDAKPATQQPTTAAPAAATPTAAPPTAVPAQILQLSAKEDGDKYTFAPATFQAKAGQVTIHYTNTAGNVRQHGFELKTVDGSADVFKSALVDSGSAADLTFTVPGPGTYTFICFQRGHVDRGQTGTIVVTAQ